MKLPSIAVAASLLSAPLVFAQRPADNLLDLTDQVRALRQSGWQTDHFARAAHTRALAFRSLMESDPARAVDAAFSPADAAKVRDWAPQDVEAIGSWDGTLETRVEDDAASATGHRRYYLTTGSGELEVFPAFPPASPACQPKVKVDGVRLNAAIATKTVQVLAAAAVCSTTGVQNTAVILVNFTNATLPANITPTFVNGAFFGAGSLSSYWTEASYGQTSATGQVYGPYTINIASCTDLTALRAAAIAAADATLDFRTITRIFIVHPNLSGCSLGVGTIGCNGLSSADGNFNASTAWMRADYLTNTNAVVSIAAHEGGHNLGLEHSSTDDYGATALGPPGVAGIFTEYWDVFSAMGLSFNDAGTILVGHYTAEQKASIGWIAAGSDYQNVTANGVFTVKPFEPTAAGTKALRIRRPGTNKWLWVEYRQNLGVDNTLGIYSSNIYNGALIHYEDPNDANYPQTLLLDFTPTAAPNNFSDAVLASGRSWSDPSTALKISVGSSTPTGLSISVAVDANSLCDLNGDGAVNVVDVQNSVNRALGLTACGNGDLDGNGSCNIVDLQRIVVAALGGACVTGT